MNEKIDLRPTAPDREVAAYDRAARVPFDIDQARWRGCNDAEIAKASTSAGERLAFEALKCGGDCGEDGRSATDTTHRQWHCGACGSWNDAPEGTEIVMGDHGEQLRQLETA
jgi:hypothetical protein